MKRSRKIKEPISFRVQQLYPSATNWAYSLFLSNRISFCYYDDQTKNLKLPVHRGK